MFVSNDMHAGRPLNRRMIKPSRRRCCVLWLLVIVMIGVWGCGRADERATTPDGDDQTLRIVSLSPAISRTLIDLGLDSHLVGRTPFCDSVDASIPIVGDLLDLNMEMLVRVQPTHVLVQPPASGIDPALMRTARERNWTVGAWHLDTIDDVRVVLEELPGVMTLHHDNPPDGLADRAASLLARIDDALQPMNEAFDGSVLLVFGLEPVTAFGEGTYLDELLAALGGRNVVTHRGYPQFSLEDITRMKPEAVILVAPGAGEEPSPKEQLGAVGGLDIPAVREGRLAVLNHPDAFLPSSGIIGVAEDVREIVRMMEQRDTSAGAP